MIRAPRHQQAGRRDRGSSARRGASPQCSGRPRKSAGVTLSSLSRSSPSIFTQPLLGLVSEAFVPGGNLKHHLTRFGIVELLGMPPGLLGAVTPVLRVVQ
jgi:hypothetical protein